MTTGTMAILTTRFRTIMAEQTNRKWERLLIFNRDLKQMIDNEATSEDYLVLMNMRVVEEMGHMIGEGEVA